MQLQEDLLVDIETEITQEPVPVGIRFLNYIIDMVVFYILAVVVTIAISSSLVAEGVFIYISTYLIYVGYFTLIEGATKGRSIGKIITRSIAVKEDGNPITWNDAFLRSLSRIVPFEPFSAFSGHPWHDKWTRTKVVKKT